MKSNKNRQNRSRSCRIEELESREMLSATLESLACDLFTEPQSSDCVHNVPSPVGGGLGWGENQQATRPLPEGEGTSKTETQSFDCAVLSPLGNLSADDADILATVNAKYGLSLAESVNVVRVTNADQFRTNVTNAPAGSLIVVEESIKTITLTGGQLTIDKNLTIVSLGCDLTIVASADSRVFNIATKNGDPIEVTLAGMTITGGNVADNGIGNNDGGGIYSIGNTLTLLNCTITGNTARNGGGIHNFGGTLTMTNCVVAKNTATDKGGGIHHTSNCTLTITNCTIAENNSGGISNATNSTLIINNSIAALNTSYDIDNDGASNHVVGTNNFIGSIQGGDELTNTLLGDPIFVDSEHDDYRLDAASPHYGKGIGANDVLSTAPLAIPTNLTLDERTPTTLTISWQEDENAEDYEIQWALTESDFEGGTLLGTGHSPTASFEIKNLSPSTTYVVRVRATAIGYEDSEWSTPVPFETEEDVVTPDPPTSPTISAQPQSATYTLGASATALSVTANGNGILSYEWYQDGSSSILSTSQYYTPPTDTVGTISYYCIITNTLDGSFLSTPSYTATITVTDGGDTVNPPTTPANFQSTAQSENSVTLTWDSQSDLTGYTLEYKKSTDSEWTTWTPAPGIDATSATITGLVANTEYNFQLTATNDDGSETSTTNATTDEVVIVVTPPTAPANFTSTEQTTDSITLSWDSQSDLTGYTLEYKKSTDSDWETWTPAPGTDATSATITGLSANTEYNFLLTAINEDGSATSTTNATTESEPIIVNPPAVPANFKSTGKTENSVTLTWEAVTGADYYEIMVDGDAWTETFTSTTAVIGNLASGTAYQFQVRAVNSDGESAWSASISATTESVITPPADPAADPVKPSKIKANSKAATISSVTLTWTANAKNAGYIITCTTPGVTLDPSQITTTSTGAVITGLQAGKSYKFTITATNADGKTTDSKGKSTAVAVSAATLKYAAVKMTVDKTKTTIDSMTLTWATASRPAGEKLVVKVIDAKTKQVVEATLTYSTGTDKKGNALSILTISGLKAGTKYTVDVQAYVGDSFESATNKSAIGKPSITTAKFTAVKMTVDKTKTTIDSVSLTWATASRPAGEKLIVKVIDAKTKKEVAATLTYSTGTDKKGNVLSILTISGLKAGTKYTVEVQAYMGDSFESATNKSAIGKPSITTATFAAVSKVVPTASDESVTLNWTLPKTITPGAVYMTYEIDWVISKTERKTVTIASVASDGKSAMVLLSTLEDLGIDFTSSKKQNFVIRAVVKDVDGNVINQSLDAAFSLTPSKLV